MSILNIIKLRLGLGPAAENHHWDGSVPNQLSLRRGTPEAPGTELIKALDGILSFPNQGQLINNPGYVKLPGGLIVQWGIQNTAVGGLTVTYPVALSTLLYIGCSHTSGATPGTVTDVGIGTRDATSCTIYTNPNVATNISWLVMGV